VAGGPPGQGGAGVHDGAGFETGGEGGGGNGAQGGGGFFSGRVVRGAAREAIATPPTPVAGTSQRMPGRPAGGMGAHAARQGVRVLGPNGPGVTTPGQCRVGIMPTHLFSPGHVGVVSRSGTLTYEIVAGLTRAGLGQSTAVGLGGDPVVGMSFVDVLVL